jgi:hypothetical protein
VKQKNEINTILQYAESSREWAGPLQSLGATDQIPEAMTTSVSYLCRLAYVYLRAALWGHDYEKYIGLTYEALRLAKKCQTQDKESMSVRCAAYVYYSTPRSARNFPGASGKSVRHTLQRPLPAMNTCSNRMHPYMIHSAMRTSYTGQQKTFA